MIIILAMTRYLALLRGINVGGNSLMKMADLKAALQQDGFDNVRTYIQSGNVFFDSPETDKDKLAKDVEKSIKAHFHLDVRVAVFSKAEWQKVIEEAPDWWGRGKDWKHNLLIMLQPYDMQQVIEAYGELKPDIEAVEVGQGVLYQSILFAKFGRTTGGKLASNPIYKQMTIRNYNTATKLLPLFD